MKALILAAGFGKRLQPITNTIPKSMVEVNGTPLLVNALNNLTALGITEIGIVVVHMADYIKDHIGTEFKGARISYYENPRYLETNNIVSCTRRSISVMMTCSCSNVTSTITKKCWKPS